MTEHPSRELDLGHLGLASYDTTERAWSFARDGFNPSFISLIGRPNVLIKPEAASVFSDNLVSRGNGHGLPVLLRKSKEDHSTKRPALVALEKAYRPDERISITILQAVETYDPLRGDLFAFGHLAGHGAFSRNVLGLVTGPNGSSLRVIALGEASHDIEPDYENDLPNELSLKTLLPTEYEGRWIGPGISIQQVCFSHMEADVDVPISRRGTRGQDMLIAVRLPDSIVILEPKLPDAPITYRNPYTGKALPSAMVDPNLVLQINVTETDNCLYTDVSFNPWYNKQLIIADSRGHVIVVELEWKKYQNVWTSRTVYALPDDVVDQDDSKETAPDGWTRVLWIADVNTVAICTRVGIRLVDMSTSDLLPVPKFRLMGSTTWMLDVRRHPAILDQLFVLTSTTLSWVRVVSAQQSGSESSMSVGANLLATHRHLRDPMDITLQMTIHTNDGQIFISIYSRLNDGVTIIRFKEPEDISEQPRMTTSTSKLPVHSQGMNTAQPSTNSLTRIVIPASLSISDNVSDGTDVQEHGIICSQFLTLQRDLSVLQSYVSFTTTAIAHNACQRLALNPSPTFKDFVGRRSQVHKSLEYVPAEEEEDFVVVDGDSEVLYEYQQTSKSHGRALPQKPNKHSPRFEFPQRSYAALVEIVASTSGVPETSLAEDGPASIIGLIERLRGLLSSNLTAGGSLYEMSGGMRADEVQNTSIILEQLFRNVDLDEDNDKPLGSHIEADSFDRFCNHMTIPADERSLEGVYKHLLGLFMMPLPQRAPARFRISLGRVIKQVAMDLVLAGARVTARIPDSRESGPIAEREEGSNMPVSATLSAQIADRTTAPYMGSVEGSSTPLQPEEYFQSSQPLPSQAYPTPSISHASVPPSPYSTTGSVSSFSTVRAAGDQARSDFLSNFVSFSDPIRPPRSATSRILQHWEFGTNPNDYTYSETQMALDRARDAAEQAEAMRGMSSNQRRKMARRAQKQSGTGTASSQYSGGTSRASSIIPASQPLPSIEEQAQSSQVQSQDQRQHLRVPDPFGLSSQIITTASQREPGRFGGRPPLKKKKKVSGF